MKEVLKKVFDKSVMAVIAVLIIFVLTFEYVVFPGLSAADTYVNILSSIIGVIAVTFLYHFVQWSSLIDYIVGKKEDIPPGETELDYIPKKELKDKKPKTKAKVKKIIIEASQVNDVEFVKKPTKRKYKKTKQTETESVSTRKPKK